MKKNDLIRNGSVAIWHPYFDKTGVPFAPCWHDNGRIFSASGKQLFGVDSAESLHETVAKNGLYLLCNDVLNMKEFPYMNELLARKNVFPFLSRTGGIPGISFSVGKRKGMLLSAQPWEEKGPDGQELGPKFLQNMLSIFKSFGYQAPTPASLSEKVLRSTLPQFPVISRPSIHLRNDILSTPHGGRQDGAKEGIFFKQAVEYDKNKAYLWHSRYVPSPYSAPVNRIHPSIEEALEYPAGFWLCELVFHSTHRLEPIVFEKRKPEEGECFERWLWSGELRDCLEAGYGCSSIVRGYGFREMSDFLCYWSDILWEMYLLAENEPKQIRDIIKAMMVGLPGRMNRRPEKYSLVPFAQMRTEYPKDIPLKLSWNSGEDSVISEWAIRPEYDKGHTALCQIGSYIVAEMRRELWRTMIAIERNGGYVIRSYIDMVACTGAEKYMEGLIGNGLGEWKSKRFSDVYALENMFISSIPDPYGWEPIVDIRAPGRTLDQKFGLVQQYKLEVAKHASI